MICSIKKYFKNLEVNVFDINLILTIVGFSLFTSIFRSVPSVIYRAVALVVAICCLRKNKYYFPNLNNKLKCFVILLIMLILKTTYELYLGDECFTIFTDSRNMVMLFSYGIVLVPFLACIKGISYYNHKTIIVSLLLILTIMLTMSVFNPVAEANTDGRFNLNERQSTLAFGDNGSYLIILCSALLAKYKEYKAYEVSLILLCLLIGVMAVLKAGSRGPVLASLAGCFYILQTIGVARNLKLLFLFLIFFIVFDGVTILENYAPILFQRMESSVQNGDMNGRDTIFEEAINKIIYGPFWGSCPVILGPSGLFLGWHNYYLTFGVGLGLTGLFSIIFFMLTLLGKSYKKRNQIKTPFELFVIAMLWLICVRGISGINPVSHCTANTVIAFSCIILYNKK